MAPKTWGDMTPAEKGALLLAHHEKKVIEACAVDAPWVPVTPQWNDRFAYRVKPDPVVEVVTLWGRYEADCGVDEWFFNLKSTDDDTHKITFDLIDGKPDCTSIKMEEL